MTPAGTSETGKTHGGQACGCRRCEELSGWFGGDACGGGCSCQLVTEPKARHSAVGNQLQSVTRGRPDCSGRLFEHLGICNLRQTRLPNAWACPPHLPRRQTPGGYFATLTRRNWSNTCVRILTVIWLGGRSEHISFWTIGWSDVRLSPRCKVMWCRTLSCSPGSGPRMRWTAGGNKGGRQITNVSVRNRKDSLEKI